MLKELKPNRLIKMKRLYPNTGFLTKSSQQFEVNPIEAQDIVRRYVCELGNVVSFMGFRKSNARARINREIDRARCFLTLCQTDINIHYEDNYESHEVIETVGNYQNKL